MQILALRRARAALLRLGYFLAATRWVLLSVVLATVGLISALHPVPVWLNVGLAIVSTLLVGVEIHDHRATGRATQYVYRGDDSFSDVEQVLDPDRFQMLRFGTGTMLLDRAIEPAARDGRLPVELAPSAYVLPTEIAEAGRLFRRRHVRSIDTYNGNVLGLSTNLGVGDTILATKLRMTPGRYYDHLASDIFAMRDVFVNHRFQPEFGRSLFVSRDGSPRDFDDSWLLNTVGTSVLAITSDHRIVMVAQSAKNESSKELLAPSGSGSLEPQDFRSRERVPLASLVANGSIREMSEETGIPRASVVGSALLGMCRWLEKSAKPEFFTLVFLSLDSHQVRRLHISSMDRPYSRWVEVVDAAPRDSWRTDTPLDIYTTQVASRLSAPMSVATALMVRGSIDPEHPAHHLLAEYWSTAAHPVADQHGSTGTQ